MSYDVLVLGGGIAGLTAAWELARGLGPSGRILVIEGDERLGGRIQTLHGWLPGPVELGAEYIHRAPSSRLPIWDYVSQFRLVTARIPKMSQSRIFYPPSERPLFAGGRRPVTAAMLWGSLRAANMFGSINRYSGPDMTAREWVQTYERPLNLDHGLGQDFVAMALTGHMPGTLDDLSIRGFAADRLSTQLEEPDEYYLTQGYDQLLNALAAGIQTVKNTRVTGIAYGPQGVVVNAADGRSFSARAGICTFSVGMLRSSEVEFSPALHPLKVDALRAIKPGHHTKVIMPFQRRFWPTGMSMAHYPWRLRRAGRTYFCLYYGDDAKPPVLTALLMGTDAQRLDALPLAGALQEICSDLDAMFPEAAPTFRQLHFHEGDPIALRKVWMEDRFARGGNSYLSTDSTQAVPVTEARAVLARADLTPGLFWAGEATALATQPASVHGANESGIRAAREVLQFLR